MSPLDAVGQGIGLDDPLHDYLRVLQITGQAEGGSFNSRARSVWAATDTLSDHPWRHRVPGGDGGEDPWSVNGTRLRAFLNTRRPRGWNDGAVWQGRGLTSALDASVSFRWKALTATLNPTILFNSNAAFELAPVEIAGQPEYAYPWWKIDYPQRFGPRPFWTFDAGASGISLDLDEVALGFGNESMWWGPGVRNAIIMSSNAPGFLHGHVGTRRPLNTGIGTLEGRWIWGRLEQSDWFDPSEPPVRFITGLVLSYSPDWLPGLSVGGARVFQQQVLDDGVPLGDYLLVFQGLARSSQFSVDETDGRDQLLSLFARWIFENSGAEVYLEWARADHAQDLYDFLQEPEHSQGYTLGLRKVTAWNADRMFVLSGELTHLEAAPTFQLRSRPTYYVHVPVVQGYTHKGQILGAWVGPGGNSQYIGFEMLDRWGSAELFLQRQIHDNDAYWEWARTEGGGRFDNHHVSFDIGATVLLFRGNFELGGGIIYTRELNRWFFGPKLNNFNFRLSARWRPRAIGAD